MAKVKDFISKATGLIGQAAVDYAPIAMAKENALRETEAAATKLKQDKLELLYKENNDTIGKIYDYAAKSIGGMTPDLQQQIDDLTYRNKILRGAMFGVDLSAEQQAAIEDMISGKEVSEKKAEDETSSIIPDWLAKFGKFVGANTLEGLEALGNAEIDILSNALGVVIDSRYDNLFSKKKVELGSKRTYTAERGQKDLNRDAITEIYNDLSSKISEEGIIDIFKESAKGKLSPQVASIINKILGFSAISPNYVFEQSLDTSDKKQGLITQGSQAQMNRVPLGSGVPFPASGGPEGMFYEEAPITSEQQAYEDARNEAALSGSGSAQIGSDAAIRSLYEDVGGPVGEPAGDTITERAKIPSEAPELEQRKQNIIKTLKDLIISAESNVNNYSAVAGSTEGDPNITSMTLGEIIKKHGNKAVGAGQFKYKEFILPILKKYLGMSEAQAKEQIFTEQFQDDLIRLGLEDAGLSQYVRNEISQEEFQKRIANIWRGLPPTKETKEGESTDQYGNKARVEGGLLFQSLGE